MDQDAGGIFRDRIGGISQPSPPRQARDRRSHSATAGGANQRAADDNDAPHHDHEHLDIDDDLDDTPRGDEALYDHFNFDVDHHLHLDDDHAAGPAARVDLGFAPDRTTLGRARSR